MASTSLHIRVEFQVKAIRCGPSGENINGFSPCSSEEGARKEDESYAHVSDNNKHQVFFLMFFFLSLSVPYACVRNTYRAHMFHSNPGINHLGLRQKHVHRHGRTHVANQLTPREMNYTDGRRGINDGVCKQIFSVFFVENAPNPVDQGVHCRGFSVAKVMSTYSIYYRL